MANKAAALFDKSCVLGALLRCERVDGRYYLYAHLLTHTKKNKILHMFAIRNSGEIAYYGEITHFDAGLHFSVNALNTRHTRPIVWEGLLDPSGPSINMTQAAVAAEKAENQPLQKRPRQIKPRFNRSGFISS